MSSGLLVNLSKSISASGIKMTMKTVVYSDTAITKATTKVYGIILGVKTPFPVPSDACQNMTCPVAQGADISYKNSVYVKQEYPSVSHAVTSQCS